MNALAADLIRQASELSASVVRPIPGSRKIHVSGSRADLRVPMREVALADTPLVFGAEKNPPLALYDTSGPYTDPQAGIDLVAGLALLRAPWIEERGDSEVLKGLSSEFGRKRAADPKLAGVRFPHTGAPRCAKAGANVSQMHYARRGIITPEMEYIAIRENQRLHSVAGRGACLRNIRAKASARKSRNSSRPNSCAARSRAAARSFRPTSITLNSSR